MTASSAHWQLMHPKFGVKRTYLAKVSGHQSAEEAKVLLEKLLGGVRLEDGRAKALEAAVHSRTPKNTWIRIVVAEGRQHLVKRLMEAVGAPVVKLFRADYGGIDVGGLMPGELRELKRDEVEMLREQTGKKAEARHQAEEGLLAGAAPRAWSARAAARSQVNDEARAGGETPDIGVGRGDACCARCACDLALGLPIARARGGVERDARADAVSTRGKPVRGRSPELGQLRTMTRSGLRSSG